MWLKTVCKNESRGVVYAICGETAVCSASWTLWRICATGFWELKSCFAEITGQQYLCSQGRRGFTHDACWLVLCLTVAVWEEHALQVPQENHIFIFPRQCSITNHSTNVLAQQEASSAYNKCTKTRKYVGCTNRPWNIVVEHGCCYDHLLLCGYLCCD